jgi:hypothetical protein
MGCGESKVIPVEKIEDNPKQTKTPANKTPLTSPKSFERNGESLERVSNGYQKKNNTLRPIINEKNESGHVVPLLHLPPINISNQPNRKSIPSTVDKGKMSNSSVDLRLPDIKYKKRTPG